MLLRDDGPPVSVAEPEKRERVYRVAIKFWEAAKWKFLGVPKGINANEEVLLQLHCIRTNKWFALIFE